MLHPKTIEWVEYYSDIGISEDIYSNYIPYISTLLSNNVPVILEFKHLSKLLGRSISYLSSVVNAPQKHYRTFNIRKKKGGFRTINVPYPALLECQKWIYGNILVNINLPECVHGFVKGNSIISNASAHLGASEMLTVDLSNFFPSIKINRVIKIFLDLGYPRNVSFYLASICCLDSCLPQGAPTSPSLSNIISKNLDSRLEGLSNQFDLKYTRYADDLTFSGDRIPNFIFPIIRRIISTSGFSINPAKTRWSKSKTSRKMVTGVVLKEKHLTVTRSYKRKINQELYYIKQFGLAGHITYNKIRDSEHLNRLMGKFAFWRQIEPTSYFVASQLKFLRSIAEG